MKHYPLSEAMSAFVSKSAEFVASDASLPSRRHAFLRACRHFTPQAPAGWLIENRRVDDLLLRIYKPSSPTPEGGWPTLLYLHGGGWAFGCLDSHDWFAFAMARRVPVAIVAVDYRLAPEHPFPAALDDTLTAWHALRAGRVGSGLSREKLVVGGDSAGGNLAAGLCIALRDANGPQPLLQALVYPVLSASGDQPSMREHADAPMLTAAEVTDSIAAYLPAAGMRAAARAMPLAAADLTGLAPAFIAVAEYDPLRDQGYAYAEALQKAGVEATLHVGEGLVHGGLLAGEVEEASQVYDALAEAIGRNLAD
ncbi:alpha/beta hydrolase [Pseudomonas fulva]|nr:alpha/beta hydrolase [Pseudomonas fulva]